MSTIRRLELADHDDPALFDALERARVDAEIALDTTIITDHGTPLSAIVPIAPGTWNEGLATIPLDRMAPNDRTGGRR
jgi:hypothetical protein